MGYLTTDKKKVTAKTLNGNEGSGGEDYSK